VKERAEKTEKAESKTRKEKKAEKPQKSEKTKEKTAEQKVKAAEVLPMPDVSGAAEKQQTPDDLLDVPQGKPKKILSFDFLDL
jgi:archaellum component FlaD/FlaE